MSGSGWRANGGSGAGLRGDRVCVARRSVVHPDFVRWLQIESFQRTLRCRFDFHGVFVRWQFCGHLLIVRRHGLHLGVKVDRLPRHSFWRRLGEPWGVGVVYYRLSHVFSLLATMF